MKSNYIKTLDGWRVIAIVLVTLSHLKYSVLEKGSILIPFFSWGSNGVDVFFALSGFLIAKNLIKQIEETGTIKIKEFYLKRTFRIMPASWLYLIIVSLIALTGIIDVQPSEIISTLTFWRNHLRHFLNESKGTYTGQFWSLSVEEVFYLFLPSFLIFLKSPDKIIKWCFGLILLVACWRKFCTFAYAATKIPFVDFTMWDTFGRFDALLAGTLLAYLSSYKNQHKIMSLVNKINPYFSIAIVALIAIVNLPFKYTFEALSFPLLIYSTIRYENSYVSKFLEMNFMKFLGKISYSYYIWQQLFTYKMAGAPQYLQMITGEWISIPIIIGIATLSYYFIEQPIREWGYKKYIVKLENSHSSTIAMAIE